MESSSIHLKGFVQFKKSFSADQITVYRVLRVRTYEIRTQCVQNGCLAFFTDGKIFFTICILFASASAVGPGLYLKVKEDFEYNMIPVVFIYFVYFFQIIGLMLYILHGI